MVVGLVLVVVVQDIVMINVARAGTHSEALNLIAATVGLEVSWKPASTSDEEQSEFIYLADGISIVLRETTRT